MKLSQARKELEKLYPGISWTIVPPAAKEILGELIITKEISEEDFERLKIFLANEQT
jgi:hypothetical protein